MRVVAIVNQKGGAAKSTTAMNLAAIAARNSRVLLVDIDPQETVTEWAGRAEANNLELPFQVVTEQDPAILARLREADFDLIFVDTPGNLQNMPVLQAVLEQSNFAILPTEAAVLSLSPVMNTYQKAVEPSGIDYRVVITRVDTRKAVDGGVVDDMKQFFTEAGLKFAQTFIRSYVDHERAPGYGATVGTYDKTRNSPKAEQDYNDLALELFAAWANTPIPAKG